MPSVCTPRCQCKSHNVTWSQCSPIPIHCPDPRLKSHQLPLAPFQSFLVIGMSCMQTQSSQDSGDFFKGVRGWQIELLSKVPLFSLSLFLLVSLKVFSPTSFLLWLVLQEADLWKLQVQSSLAEWLGPANRSYWQEPGWYKEGRGQRISLSYPLWFGLNLWKGLFLPHCTSSLQTPPIFGLSF